MNRSIESSHQGQDFGIFLQASGFGLICGLIDGILQVVLQHFRWINWGGTYFFWVSREILWVSPVVYFFLFNLLGIAIILLRRVLRMKWPDFLPFVFFLFLTAYDWLILAAAGHLKRYAVLLLALACVVTIKRKWGKGRVIPTLRQVASVAAIVVALIVIVQASVIVEEANAARGLVSADAQAPNVVLIIVDALRADHLSSYGYSRPTSPHLDRIASEGVIFENALSTSSWTLPAHTSLLTGRYPREHGVQEVTQVFEGNYPTLAEYLGKLGYRTGGFTANTTFFSRAVGLGRGFIHFEDAFTNVGNSWIRTGYGREFYRVLRYFSLLDSSFVQDLTGLKRAGDIVHSILNWVDRDTSKPFLIVANVADTHYAYVPPEPFFSRFAGAPGGARAVKRPDDGQLYLGQDQIDVYDGAVAYVDEQLGELFKQLQARNPNTIVMVTSDHGEAFGEHGFFMHDQFLYRELIHVPLVVSWPGHLPSGVRVSQPVTCAAVPATVMALLGLDDKVFPGPPLTKLWGSSGVPSNWPYPESQVHGSSRSLVNGDWHYIEQPKKVELYNWRLDPDELKNLAGTSEGQPVVGDFRAYISHLADGP